LKIFAEVGDNVIYTGNVKGVDDSLANMMRSFFTPGCGYVVRGIDKESECYRFKNYAYAYPCKCFVHEYKEVVKFLYGLK